MDWIKYFTSISLITALKSKDPSTQVGAVVVNTKNIIVSTGYNGAPRGVDDSFITEKTGPIKYAYVVHAELNAILNAKQALDGFSLFCNVFPCNECMKSIIQSGIKKVYYLHLPSMGGSQSWADAVAAAKTMAAQAGVQLIQVFLDPIDQTDVILQYLDTHVRLRK